MKLSIHYKQAVKVYLVNIVYGYAVSMKTNKKGFEELKKKKMRVEKRVR